MNRIYVKINGRLGNQFFQYAFARKLQSQIGGELILDFTSLNLNMKEGLLGQNGVENHLVNFNVRPYRYIDLGNYDKSLIPSFQRKIFDFMRKIKPMTRRKWYVELIELMDHRLLQSFGIYFLESVNPYKYLKFPTKARNLLVRGWFEGACYFDDIAADLRQELRPKHSLPPQLEGLYADLLANEYICVTIRRGDFTADAYRKRYLICTPEYYRKGVNTIKGTHPDAKIFVCSDDIDWCKENLDFGSETLFEPEGLPIWEKIRLMSASKHFVLSNSTFSWWCQFLSDYEEKTVVAPSVWRNENPAPTEIYGNNWILL